MNRPTSLQARPIEAGSSDNWEVSWLERSLVGSGEIKKIATFETYDAAVNWAITNRDLDLHRKPMLNCFTDDTSYGGPFAPWEKYFDDD